MEIKVSESFTQLVTFLNIVRWRNGRRSGDGTPVSNPITGSNPVLTTNLHEFYLKLHANIIYMNKNILEEENIVLKKALQDLIDFHHHIGNEDCPYNRNYILVTMYNI